MEVVVGDEDVDGVEETSIEVIRGGRIRLAVVVIVWTTGGLEVMVRVEVSATVARAWRTLVKD